MSWLGLCRGWMARETWEWSRRTFVANSFTPASRITFPMACWMGIPSSTAAKINRRANSGSRKSCAKPCSQSLLALAMHHLQIVDPELLREANVLALRGFVSAKQQQNNSLTLFPEVYPISGPERQSRFPDTGSDGFMITEISCFESEDPGLHPCSHRNIKCAKPLTKMVFPLCSHILPNRNLHSGVNDNRPAAKCPSLRDLSFLRSAGCTL